MLHELASTADRDTERAKHSLALANIGFPVFLILNIDIEGFTLKEDFQVSVMLKNGMTGNLVKHTFQSSSPRLDKVGIKSAHGLLLGRRSNNHSGVVTVHRVIKPKEITVSTADCEFGLTISLR
jgi:hypothetical protein